MKKGLCCSINIHGCPVVIELATGNACIRNSKDVHFINKPIDVPSEEISED